MHTRYWTHRRPRSFGDVVALAAEVALVVVVAATIVKIWTL